MHDMTRRSRIIAGTIEFKRPSAGLAGHTPSLKLIRPGDDPMTPPTRSAEQLKSRPRVPDASASASSDAPSTTGRWIRASEARISSRHRDLRRLAERWNRASSRTQTVTVIGPPSAHTLGSIDIDPAGDDAYELRLVPAADR